EILRDAADEGEVVLDEAEPQRPEVREDGDRGGEETGPGRSPRGGLGRIGRHRRGDYPGKCCRRRGGLMRGPQVTDPRVLDTVPPDDLRTSDLRSPPARAGGWVRSGS